MTMISPNMPWARFSPMGYTTKLAMKGWYTSVNRCGIERQEDSRRKKRLNLQQNRSLDGGRSLAWRGILCAKEILILADSGGSNGNRCRMWKFKLQEKLSSKDEVKITVCHYPPGASKWNRIEHRLFSEISKNWRGVPLKTFETVLKYTRTTKTTTGVKVYARAVTKTCRAGKSVSKADFEKVELTPHKVLPCWNYSIDPAQAPN